MAKASPLALGRIVWAEVADARGTVKLRPAVVVTATGRIQPDQSVEIVAITRSLPGPLPEDHVLLPWHAAGHPRTGLNPKCAAVCGWIRRVMPADIRVFAGVVLAELLLQILTKMAAAGRSS